MKVAFLFPGQGAQKVGMGKELHGSSPSARSAFDRADEALGEPLSRIIFEGPGEDLTLTANTQPSILTVSTAALWAFREQCDIEPAFVAGHSLGEFSALVAAGAMTFEDAVRTTRRRGQLMQDAVPPGQGAMAAVMKLDDAVIEEVCLLESVDDIVSPANFNSPEQTVISGGKQAVERASAELKKRGGRVIPLKVSAPFHCRLMEPAARGLDTFLEEVTFSPPRIPIVSNVEATPNSDPGRVRELLVKQVTSPVRWTESMRLLLSEGVDRFVEFGPGNVLAGLLRKIDPEAKVVSVGAPENIEDAIRMLETNH